MIPVIRFTQQLLLVGICMIAISSCEQHPTVTPLTDDAVILAFGDSLTFGTGAAKGQSYPDQLQKLLKRNMINAGVPGETSARGLQRLPSLLKKHNPDLVILCHGGNDILRRLRRSTTENNLQAMIELAQRYGADVILIGVPEFGLFLHSAPIYKALAEHNNVPVENEVLGDVLGKTRLKSDQVHPNTDGYALMARRIHELMEKSGAI